VLWTLTIVFLPFPTALLPDAGDQSLTKILYIGAILVSTLLIAAVEWIVRIRPEITDGLGQPDLRVTLATCALLVVALALTLPVRATSYYPLLLLFLTPPVAAILERIAAARSRTS